MKHTQFSIETICDVEGTVYAEKWKGLRVEVRLVLDEDPCGDIISQHMPYACSFNTSFCGYMFRMEASSEQAPGTSAHSTLPDIFSISPTLRLRKE